MGKVVVPIRQTDISVTRLAVKSVIEQLVFATDIKVEDIIYVERGGKAAMAQELRKDATLKLDVGNHIIVNYKETFTPDGVDIDIDKPEYLPIFTAMDLGVMLTPIHTKVNIEMNITYKQRNYNELQVWLNTLHRSLIRSSPSNSHTIMYNYTIPTDVLAYLYNVYVLTERVAPYGKTLEEWVALHFTSGVMVRHNMADTARAVAINIKNTQCIGMYTQLPENIETTKEPPASEVQFVYTLSYDLVTALTVDYQKFIHNQIVDLSMLRKYGDRRVQTLTYPGNRIFTSSVSRANKPTDSDLINIWYDLEDTWHPNEVPRSTTSILMVPIEVDLVDLRDVVNLHAINSPRVPASMLEVITRNSYCVVRAYKSPIQVYLYEVGREVNLIPIDMDESLYITSRVDLDPRKRYYLRIAIVTDLTLVDLTCSNLRHNGPDLLYLLHALDPNLPPVQTVGNGAYVTDFGLNTAVNWLNSTNHLFRVYYGTHRYFIVSDATISAARNA